MKSLQETGIGPSTIQRALDLLKSEKAGQENTPSLNTYIRCPIDLELWDLKPTVCCAFELASSSISVGDFNSRRFQKELVQMGFPVVRFEEKKSRKLGLSGCDLQELQAPHIVFWPPDLREQRNGFRNEAIARDNHNPTKQRTLVNQYVRNSELRKKHEMPLRVSAIAAENAALKRPTAIGFLRYITKNGFGMAVWMLKATWLPFARTVTDRNITVKTEPIGDVAETSSRNPHTNRKRRGLPRLCAV